MSSVKTVGSRVFWVVTLAALFAGFCLTGCGHSGGGSSGGAKTSGSITEFFDPGVGPIAKFDINIISTAYAAFSTFSAGTSTGVKSGAHGLIVGDHVTIAGTTNYNGTHLVQDVPTPDTFVIDTPFVAAETTSTTGTWTKVAPTTEPPTTPTNGACGGANGSAVPVTPTAGLCTSGTSTTVSTNASSFDWSCMGSNGGTNATCSANLQLDGSCGTDNGSLVTTAPTANLCASTTITPTVTGTAPGPFTWTCKGNTFGHDAACATGPVNGACGSSNTSNVYSATDLTLLCTTTGTTPTTVSGTGPFTWSCTGINGGTNASCSANLKVDGACGSANSTLVNADPTGAALCSAGTPGAIATNPDPTGTKTWSCNGQNTGASPSCSADYCYVVTVAGDPSAITLPNPAAVASRFSGVAPLAVFFDATGTAATATSKPFHELEYRWNFGDDDTATWSYGSHVGDGSVLAKKNRATGPVAAHVFETPGTLPVILTVTDGTNTVANSSKCARIVVQDPDLIFAGTKTTCIASGAAPVAGVGGCPSGAAVAGGVTSINTAIATYCNSAQTRCLLKSGDTFSHTTSTPLGMTGPNYIGSYPVGTATPAKIINTGTPSGTAALSGFGLASGVNDVRLVDLEFPPNGDGNDGHRIVASSSGNGSYSNVTFLRMNIHDIGAGFEISIGSGSTAVPDHLFLVDSQIQRLISVGGATPAHGWLSGSRRTALMGNLFDDSTGGSTEHMIRISFMDRGVISNNQIQKVHTTKEMVSLRSPCMVSTSCTSGNDFSASGLTGAAAITRKAIISNNNILANTYSGVDLNSMSVQDQDEEDDVIIERNFIQSTSGGGTGVSVAAATNRVTVRNNVIDTTLNTSGNIAIATNVASSFGPAPDSIWIYNNSLFDNSSASGIVGIRVRTGATNVVVTNNIAYAPNGTGTLPVLLSDSTGAVTANNNSTNTQVTTKNPGWNAPATLFNPTVAKLLNTDATGGVSYAIDGGIAVPLFSDFFGVLRPGGSAYDIGATEQ